MTSQAAATNPTCPLLLVVFVVVRYGVLPLQPSPALSVLHTPQLCHVVVAQHGALRAGRPDHHRGAVARQLLLLGRATGAGARVLAGVVVVVLLLLLVVLVVVVVVLACLHVALPRGRRHEAWPCGMQRQQGALDHFIVQGVDELLRLSGDEIGVMQGEGESGG